MKLRSLGTNVSPVLVIATGATELRDVFSGNVLENVLVSYMTGIKVTFAITTAALGVSFLIIHDTPAFQRAGLFLTTFRRRVQFGAKCSIDG